MKKILSLTLALLLFGGFCASADETAYIVRLKENAPLPISAEAEALFPEAGLYLVNSLEEIHALGEAVEAYGQDQTLELLDFGEAEADPFAMLQWHLPAIHAEYAKRFDVRGQGVTVAVLDSGINFNSDDFKNVNVLSGISCFNDSPDVKDMEGHGTVTSGLIAAGIDNGRLGSGIADGVTLMPVKVAKASVLSESVFIKGMKYALDNGADVVNMSLGGGNAGMMEAGIQALIDRGVIVVAASGNSGEAKPEYPASFEGVIAVGGVTADLVRSSYSSYYPGICCVAPSADLYAPDFKVNYKLASKGRGGTSYSAPIVSAAAALAKSVDPSLTPEGFRLLMEESCTDLGPEGYDVEYGYGLLNIEEMLKRQFEKLPPVSIYQSRTEGGEAVYRVRNTAAPIEVTAKYGNEERSLTLDAGYAELRFAAAPNAGLSIYAGGELLAAAQ